MKIIKTSHIWALTLWAGSNWCRAPNTPKLFEAEFLKKNYSNLYAYQPFKKVNCKTKKITKRKIKGLFCDIDIFKLFLY